MNMLKNHMYYLLWAMTRAKFMYQCAVQSIHKINMSLLWSEKKHRYLLEIKHNGNIVIKELIWLIRVYLR